MDVAMIVNERHKAAELGMLNDQLAMYDFNKNEEVKLPARQKTGTLTQQSTYLKLKAMEV